MRLCLDCRTSIDHRHGKSKRCVPCQHNRNRMEANRRYNEKKPFKTCLHCKRLHRRVEHHCSIECRTAGAKRRKVKGPKRRICANETCRLPFVSSRHQLFCQVECSKESRRRRSAPDKLELVCSVCDERYVLERGDLKLRKTKYCSYVCRRTAQSMMRHGVKGDKHLIRLCMTFDFCMSCFAPFEEPSRLSGRHIDHDHASGWFRGVICGRCNVAAGMQPDSRALRLLADYLDRTTPVLNIGAIEWSGN